MSKSICSTLIFLALVFSGGSNTLSLEIRIRSAANILPQETAVIKKAAAIWSSIFTDKAVIIIDVVRGSNNNYGRTHRLAAAAPFEQSSLRYDQFRQLLVNDSTSKFDKFALQKLPIEPRMRFLLNRTRDNPHGPYASKQYLDDGVSRDKGKKKTIC